MLMTTAANGTDCEESSMRVLCGEESGDDFLGWTRGGDGVDERILGGGDMTWY